MIYSAQKLQIDRHVVQRCNILEKSLHVDTLCTCKAYIISECKRCELKFCTATTKAFFKKRRYGWLFIRLNVLNKNFHSFHLKLIISFSHSTCSPLCILHNNALFGTRNNNCEPVTPSNGGRPTVVGQQSGELYVPTIYRNCPPKVGQWLPNFQLFVCSR